MRTIRVDGNDVLAVYAATQLARSIALEHDCPVLIEAMTYRLAAHSTSDDPSGYRSQAEEEKWRARDPIMRMQLWLESKGWFDQTQHEKAVIQVRQDVLAALKKAEQVPVNPISDIVEDVYDSVPWHLEKQRTELEKHIKQYPDAYPKTAGRVK